MESKLCACGCGMDILKQNVRPKTREYWKYHGLPRYIMFHGAKIINREVALRLHPRKKLVCFLCKTEFEVQSRQRLGKKQFCSWECVQTFRRSLEGREECGSHRKGMHWSKSDKKYRRDFNKNLIKDGNTEFMKNLKHCDLTLKRKCKFENCENYVFGKANYCSKHYLKTLEGKISNRSRAFLHSKGIRVSAVDKNIFDLVRVLYITKEIANENRTGNERNVVGCLQGNSQGVVVNS